MPRATVTSKGQITIPKVVRDALDVSAGDQVAFLIGADGTITVQAASVNLNDLKGVIKSSVKGVSIEDMNQAIRRMGSRK